MAQYTHFAHHWFFIARTYIGGKNYLFPANNEIAWSGHDWFNTQRPDFFYYFLPGLGVDFECPALCFRADNFEGAVADLLKLVDNK